MTSSLATKVTVIPFEDDIKKLTQYFTGRDWLFKDIDNWLKNKKDDRFFLLTGEPGVGKSAIAAQLTQIPNIDITAYHFCRDRDVETVRPERILRSLAAQLAEKIPEYGEALAKSIKPNLLQIQANIDIKSVSNSQIRAVYIENLNPSDPENELDILIRAPFVELQKMYAKKQQQPPNSVVILINSLDEAVNTTGTNIVKLLAKLSKSDLPDWVRFVLTSRRGGEVAQELKELKPYDLEQTSKENLDDVEEYIQERVKQPQLQEVLQKNQSTQSINQIIKRIAELANGNFLYTKLLLDDIEAKRQSLDDLSALPKTINDIYHRWLMRLKEKWEERYQPILGIMTVAQEPLTEKQLVNFTGIDSEYLHNSLPEVVQFLNEVKPKENNSTYAIFHRSLRDYLLEESDKFFGIAPQKHHSRIIEYYYKEDAQSEEEVNWSKLDKYGWLHLSKHLNSAEKEQELYKLLTGSPDWMNNKFNFFYSDVPYVDDLELAINKFADPLKPEKLLTLVKLYTVRQVVHQRANRYRDIDLITLIWLGNEEKALSNARLRANANSIIKALLIIHNALLKKGQLNSAVLDEAKKILDSMEEGWTQTLALWDLAIALVQLERLSEAEELKDKINNTNTWVKTDILPKLAAAFAKAGDVNKADVFFQEAEKLTTEIDDNQPVLKAEALRELAVTLVQAGSKFSEQAIAVFDKAELVTRNITNTDIPVKVKALSKLAAALAQVGNDKQKAIVIFSEAKELADHKNTEKDFSWAEVQRELAVALAQAGFAHDASDIFHEVEKFAHQQENWGKAEALRTLAIALVQAKDIEKGCAVFDKAIKVPNTFDDAWQQVEVLRNFAETLVQTGFTEKASTFFFDARKATSTIKGNWQKAEALRNLAAALVQNDFTEDARTVFTEAEKLTANLEDTEAEQALNKWALVLEQAGFHDKASAICANNENFAEELKQEINHEKEYAKSFREKAKTLTLAQERYKLSADINRVVNSSEVRKIAQAAIDSDSFQEAKDLAELAIVIAQLGELTAAKKVVYAIEDESEQSEALIYLAKAVAWIGYFEEALSILGLINEPSKFLDELVDWISASENFEQNIIVDILQETTRIFGWMYPYWNKIYNDLISNVNKANFSLYANQGLFSDINPIIIPLEQAQNLEACIQEAVDILYHHIPKNGLTTIESINQIVLEQIILSISTQIAFLHQSFEQTFNIISKKE